MRVIEINLSTSSGWDADTNATTGAACIKWVTDGHTTEATICRLQVHLKALGQIGFVLMKVQCRSAVTDCMDPNKNPTFLRVINDPVSGVFTHHYGNNHPPRCTTLLGTLPYVFLLYLKGRMQELKLELKSIWSRFDFKSVTNRGLCKKLRSDTEFRYNSICFKHSLHVNFTFTLNSYF